MTGASNRTSPAAARSPLAVRLFRLYAVRYFARHFTALRIRGAWPQQDLAAGTILYSNHPSWWDPIVMVLTASSLFPNTQLFAPIEARALERYPILRRLGLFPVDASAEGTRRFLADSGRLLDAGHAMAITAQGTFADHRQRPVALRRGLAHLLRADERRIAIPVALEYGFWNNRLPEALVSFGEPVAVPSDSTPADATTLLEQHLTRELDALEKAALGRDEAEFRTLIGRGATDVDGIYGLIRQLKPESFLPHGR